MPLLVHHRSNLRAVDRKDGSPGVASTECYSITKSSFYFAIGRRQHKRTRSGTVTRFDSRLVLLRHDLGITASAFAIFFYGNLNELSTERLYLLSRSRAGVKSTDYGSKSSCLMKRGIGKQEWGCRLTVEIALRPATPAPMTKTLPGGIYD